MPLLRNPREAGRPGFGFVAVAFLRLAILLVGGIASVFRTFAGRR
jgi:hypothetical protein